MKRLLSTVAILCSVACNNPVAPTPPAAFDRPEDVTFFCWNLDAEAVTALADCTPATPESIADDLGAPPTGYALHALVTQTTTGEVAAVRLTGDTGEPGVIDSDVRIPGFTFAAVGEVPSALAVSETAPELTYVLARGSNEVHVIETAAFRTGQGVAAQAFPLPVPTDRPRTLPSAMRLSRDQSSLVVALAESGQLAQIPLSDGTLGEPVLLDLSSELPAPVDLTTVPQAERPTWRFTCPEDMTLIEPVPVGPREPVMLGDSPEPAAIIEDEETGELLIADRALPLVHVIDPDTFTEVRAINVQVPVQALALSPFVPATVGDIAPTERYLYAIDATDGSVLALDWSDPARASFGGVISVEIDPPADRFDTPFPARDLAVVSPTYDPALVCNDADDGLFASGINLHGVFLAVGTVDGRIRFFDVFDQDTACRGASCSDAMGVPNEDVLVTIMRHRPRLGVFRDTDVLIDPAPIWDTDGVGTEPVDDLDGEANGAQQLVPTMTPVTCEAPLAQAFPETGPARVCVVTDPWAAISQTFTIAYEAAIPFTTTTGANFEIEGDGFSLVTQTDYCGRGVIGAEQVPTDGGYLTGYAGDVAVITADLPPSILQSGDDALVRECEQLLERTTGGEFTPVRIQITRASSNAPDLPPSYVGRLQLGAVLQPEGATLDEVARCYPELLQIEVRTQDVFTVSAGRRGFVHPIVAAPMTGECMVDPALAEANQRGRAFFDSVFQNDEITFAFGSEPPDIEGRNPQLEITPTQVPTPLSVDVSSVGGITAESLLTRLSYNPVDERLYAVDQSVQGLLRIKLTQLSVQQTFR